MSETSLLLGWVNLTVLNARVDSRFWYALAERFRLCDQAGELSAELNAGPTGVPWAPWVFRPITHTMVRTQFEKLALEAWSGVELPVDGHNKGGGIYSGRLVGAWLDVVWSYLLLPKSALESRKDDGGVEYARTIPRVCETSSIVCTVLGNQAREIELDRQSHGLAAITPGTEGSKVSEFEVPVERAATRRAWAESIRPGQSIYDWAQRTKIDYKTLRDYLNGKTTRQTRRTRQKLAEAEKAPFSTVPE
jgi:hypothetical protein